MERVRWQDRRGYVQPVSGATGALQRVRDRRESSLHRSWPGPACAQRGEQLFAAVGHLAADQNAVCSRTRDPVRERTVALGVRVEGDGARDPDAELRGHPPNGSVQWAAPETLGS